MAEQLSIRDYGYFLRLISDENIGMIYSKI